MLPRITPILLFCSALASAGELKLISVFSDHAVLQAGDAAVFGKAHPGSKVSVKLGSSEASATAGNDGKWRTALAGLKPSEQGMDLIVSSGEEVFTAHDVIVGEVWIGSGQSNMDMSVGGCLADVVNEAKSHARDNGLRVFYVPHTPKAEAMEDMPGVWKIAAPDTVASFSAAAFFFGRDVRASIKQPVGLIHSSIGGYAGRGLGSGGNV